MVIVLTMPLYSQGKGENKPGDSSSPYLKWVPVTGATEYIVEIINSNSRSVITRRVDTNTLKVSLARGEYRFRVGAVNKFNKVGSWSEWASLVIVETPLPGFNLISPNKAERGVDGREITLAGENIVRGALVRLSRDDLSLDVSNIRYRSDSEIQFNVQLDNAETGSYDLEIVNPGGKRVRAEDVFIVEDSRRGRKPAADMPVSFNISLGYHAAMPVSSWSDVLEVSMAGFHVAGDTGLHAVPVLKYIPFADYLGFLLEGSYTAYSGKDRTAGVTTSMNLIHGGGRIFYPLRMMASIVLKISAGGGIALSSFNEQAEYSEPAMYTSRDEYFVSGLSVEIPFSPSFFMESGIDYMIIRYVDVPMHSIRFSATGGVRF